MIKYKLTCKNCDQSFDSWFSTSSDFDKLKKKNFLACHYCNSKKIEKSLMAPRLINNSQIDKLNKDNQNFKKISKKLNEYKKFIEKNFDNVGENFAHEARTIHYNNKERKRGIYGTASTNEIKELREEGIDAEIIPWIENKSN